MKQLSFEFVGLLSAQLVKKGLVRNEAIFILLFTKLLKKLGAVFLGDFITYLKRIIMNYKLSSSA